MTLKMMISPVAPGIRGSTWRRSEYLDKYTPARHDDKHLNVVFEEESDPHTSWCIFQPTDVAPGKMSRSVLSAARAEAYLCWGSPTLCSCCDPHTDPSDRAQAAGVTQTIPNFTHTAQWHNIHRSNTSGLYNCLTHFDQLWKKYCDIV